MNIVRLKRLDRGWSINRLAQLTGISSPDISMLERNLRPEFPGWRQRIARAFKVPQEEIFKEDLHYGKN